MFEGNIHEVTYDTMNENMLLHVKLPFTFGIKQKNKIIQPRGEGSKNISFFKTVASFFLWTVLIQLAINSSMNIFLPWKKNVREVFI